MWALDRYFSLGTTGKIKRERIGYFDLKIYICINIAIVDPSSFIL